MELTKKQLEQQDFVDSAIFDLLETINPTEKKLDWNIEIVGAIRDMVAIYFEDNRICKEQEFYPYIEE
jgi:hypothetical protein